MYGRGYGGLGGEDGLGDLEEGVGPAMEAVVKRASEGWRMLPREFPTQGRRFTTTSTSSAGTGGSSEPKIGCAKRSEKRRGATAARAGTHEAIALEILVDPTRGDHAAVEVPGQRPGGGKPGLRLPSAGSLPARATICSSTRATAGQWSSTLCKPTTRPLEGLDSLKAQRTATGR